MAIPPSSDPRRKVFVKPDLLHLIISYLDIPSLVRCLRVSESFQLASGSHIYLDVKLTSELWGKWQEYAEVEDVPSKPFGPGPRNTFLPLVKLVKTLDISCLELDTLVKLSKLYYAVQNKHIRYDSPSGHECHCEDYPDPTPLFIPTICAHFQPFKLSITSPPNCERECLYTNSRIRGPHELTFVIKHHWADAITSYRDEGPQAYRIPKITFIFADRGKSGEDPPDIDIQTFPTFLNFIKALRRPNNALHYEFVLLQNVLFSDIGSIPAEWPRSHTAAIDAIRVMIKQEHGKQAPQLTFTGRKEYFAQADRRDLVQNDVDHFKRLLGFSKTVDDGSGRASGWYRRPSGSDPEFYDDCDWAMWGKWKISDRA